MPETEAQIGGLATTIDEVIEQLNAIIARSREEKSRLGFFPVLYRDVTVKVKDGIASGRFEDGDRMERLDVLFANRYIEAYQQFRTGTQPTKSWQVAFDAANTWRLLILQHLLLGINAHINLDLGIAAARTAPGEQLPGLKADFHEINNILAELLDVVQDKIGVLSPWLGLLDQVGGRTDEAIVNFSIQKARDASWQVAERLAPLSIEQQEAEIARLDQNVADFAQIVQNPGWLLRIISFLIRIAESGNVVKIINVLS
ncbi:hypothetical protein GWO43_01955 [candidate division KSB1 bacterium]|nr:hypothetical protein [candidate division KSB1 bacterium]NIR69487.1 hypothetical protein [candidate division KSB1 bacterium]NIS22837.1 hypothetical protein [candidate division KSB1 bacterium]NIT69676.1 hypothetical protein [candidate division KSB1 bacterium]NIU23346.1 hypothetical protein [candidate division KSB1 bacterium]